MLAVGANDGQLHLFDAGLPIAGASSGAALYTRGSGRELFSFVPRGALAPLARAALGGSHEYSVDATVVVDDALTDDGHSSVREWRTVLIGGLGRGGSGYYALDITQPDRLEPTGLPDVTSYVPSCLEGGSACGMPSPYPRLQDLPGREFPRVLWELTDDEDEDGNGAPDLGESWSRAATGRIRTSRGDRFVAVFGGGLDPDLVHKESEPEAAEGTRGNHLYMVDMLNGEIFYKRPLDHPLGRLVPTSVPGGPAAIDLDFDGYLDAIYVGTTGGYLFKVDLTSAGEFGAGGRISGSAWEPFPIFDTGGRPIYHAPRAFFLASSGRPALAFGTGDRQNLWRSSGQDGRFYVLVDQGHERGQPPLTEASLEAVGATGALRPVGASLLEEERAPEGERVRTPGWTLLLRPEERLLDAPVVAAGVLLFDTYTPATAGSRARCAGTGVTRSYALVVTNANPAGGDERSSESPGILAPSLLLDVAISSPLSSQGGSPAGTTGSPCTGAAVSDLRQRLAAELHPAGCRFGQRSLEVIALDGESGGACRVSLPVCTLRRGWRERLSE
jgi:type IV pilus assembly protein PilY1